MALAFGSTGSDIVSLITGLAWPVLVGVVVVLLLPSIRKTIDSRGFTVKAGGMEISVQDASEQLATRLDDLRNRVIGLEDGNGGEEGGTAVAPPVQPPEPAAAAPPAAHPAPSEPQAAPRPRLRNILWVDDVPSNNAFEIDALQRKGVHITSAVSSQEAWRALDGNGKFDVIITDMGREAEGRDAGLTLIRDLKAHEVTTPVIVYASAAAVARTRDDALQLGAYASTASATELMSLLNTLGLE